MPSYYLPDLSPAPGSFVSLSGSEHHHLATVRRQAVGDLVTLTDGKGLLIRAKIRQIGKKDAELELIERIEVVPPADYAIAFSLLKSQHDELIVEKCTELGAKTLFPFISDSSVRKPSANTAERFAKIALAAIKQCDSPFLPEIHATTQLKKLLQNITTQGYTPVICSERRPDRWIEAGEYTAPPCFVIGPEGGWSEAEFQLFSELGLPEITFSPLIARAETAAIAIASQWLISSKLLSIKR